MRLHYFFYKNIVFPAEAEKALVASRLKVKTRAYLRLCLAWPCVHLG